MYESDFWASCAEAMELSIEGNRLIGREIAAGVRGLWQRSIRSLEGMMRGFGQHGHLPPI